MGRRRAIAGSVFPRSIPFAPPSRRLVVSCFALIIFPGCESPFGKDYLSRVIPPEEVRQIEPIKLEDQSRSEPVTVEDATAQAIERLVQPQPPPAVVDLSIEQVRAWSLERNLELAVELINPSIAAQFLNEERAKFEATFFGSARRAITDSPTAVGTEGTKSIFDQYDVGVRIPLRTGGTATLDLPMSKQDTNNPFSLLNPAYSADARFSISQPLLRGAWDDATMHSIRVAAYQTTAAEARSKLESIRILANADRAYWRLFAAQRELIVRQQQYELAVAQLSQARRKVVAGEVADIETIRAESGVASSLEAIIVAETLVKRFQRDLKRILNRDDLPMDGPTAINVTTPPDPVGLDLDRQKLAEYALANRMEMLELELQLAIDASTIAFEKNAALPLVLVDYTYSISGLGSDYEQAFDQISHRSFEDQVFGLRAEIPLGNEAAKARVNRAILQRLQRLATKEQRRSAIQQEVYDALDQMMQNWQRILAARQAAILAGRTYEAEKRQFDVGIRTSTDVLDAAARLADAQSSEIRALADYQIAQVDIAFATGTLLGKDLIVWGPPDSSGTAPAPRPQQHPVGPSGEIGP